jgi:hypothetical protein
MKATALGLVAGIAGALAVGHASAQTATTTPAPAMTPAPVTTMATPAPVNSATTGSAAASSDSNQAVATTNANAPLPAKGANSFTMGEARSRIEKNGFSHVTGLNKDSNGVWHGHADKDGTQTAVWLDYKGDVGTN